MNKLQRRQPLPVRLARVPGGEPSLCFYGWVLTDGCPHCGEMHRYVLLGVRRGQDPRPDLPKLRPWMLCQEEKARELKLKGVSAEKRLGFPIYDADPQNTERILLADADGAASRAIRSGVWLDLIQPHDNSPSGDPPPEFLAATGPSYIWLQKPCGLCGGGHLYYAGPVAEDPMELLHQVHAVPDCRPGQKGLILHVFYDIDPDTTKRLMQDNSLTVERTINARTRTEEGGKGTCTVQ